MSTHLEIVDIVLNGNKKRFQSGEDVTGVIRFSLKGSSIVKKIKISLISDTEVKWIESSHIICDIDSYISDEVLSEGKHEVPFSFKLPKKGIPSSFVGPHGSIKYYIEVIVEEPDVEKDHRVGLLEFVVDSPHSEEPNFSIECSKEKELGLLNLADGKLILYANLSKKGWTRGEVLELHVTVDNVSTVDVTPRASLHQTQVYMSGERHKGKEVVITESIVGKTVHRNSNLTETLFIPLPEDLSLSIKSGIISVKYFIHVSLDIPHAIDLHVNLPIVVVDKFPFTE